MGLRPLEPGRWIELGSALPPLLAEKRRLFVDRPDAVVATVPDPGGTVRTAAVELRSLLAAHLRDHHSEWYRCRAPTLPGDGLEVVDGGGGQITYVDFHDDSPPIAHCGLLTPEDWCLHLPDPDGRWVLVAASVSFPTRWVLADKIGRTVTDVHAPVSAYRPLARPVERFLDRLRPETPMWRLNWNLVDRPELFQPTAGPDPDPPIAPGEVGERVFLRVERQTMRRLADSGAVVFSIRVHQHPLGTLREVPGATERLADALAAMPERTRVEKGLTRCAPAVEAWLAGTSA